MYSRSDWVLAFLYRSSSFSRYVAGLHAVEHLDTKTVLENVDVTALVTGSTCLSLSLSLALSLSCSLSLALSLSLCECECECMCVCVCVPCQPEKEGWGVGRKVYSKLTQ